MLKIQKKSPYGINGISLCAEKSPLTRNKTIIFKKRIIKRFFKQNTMY